MEQNWEKYKFLSVLGCSDCHHTIICLVSSRQKFTQPTAHIFEYNDSSAYVRSIRIVLQTEDVRLLYLMILVHLTCALTRLALIALWMHSEMLCVHHRLSYNCSCSSKNRILRLRFSCSLTLNLVELIDPIIKQISPHYLINYGI